MFFISHSLSKNIIIQLPDLANTGEYKTMAINFDQMNLDLIAFAAVMV